MEEAFERLVRAQEELGEASARVAAMCSGFLVDLVKQESLAGCGPEVAEAMEMKMDCGRFCATIGEAVCVTLEVCPLVAENKTERELVEDKELLTKASQQARWMIEATKLAYRQALAYTALPTLTVQKMNGDIAFENGTLCLRCKLFRTDSRTF